MSIKITYMTATLLPILAVVAFAKPDKTTPIVFPKGKKTVVITGALSTPKSKAYFTLATKKGEKYEFKVTGSGTAVVMVQFPDKTEDGGPGGIEVEVPKTGVSRIEVHGNGRSGTWKGKFTLAVKQL